MSQLLSSTAIPYPGLERLLDGRYQVTQVVDVGEWGRTYLAQDTRRPSQPDCIIQHLIPLVADPAYCHTFRHLFVREALTLERLGESQQVSQMLACFEDEQGFYLVQATSNGTPLSQELLPGQPWSAASVVQLLLECLEPLAIVHADCCRHGDLRPDNLVRQQDGKLILTNFGTIREIHRSLMTLHGRVSSPLITNTQGYQPPEQVQGLPCLASDLYAIGVIAMQALTGVLPTQLERNASTGKLIWPAAQQHASTLHHGLVAVINRLIDPDHTQRYLSALEGLQAVRQLLPMRSLNQVSSQPVPLIATALTAQSEPARENTPIDYPARLHRMSMLQVGLGVGVVAAAAISGYALPHFIDGSWQRNRDPGRETLQQATQQYQAGQMQTAIGLAATIPPESAVYPMARTEISHWQTDGPTAERQYQAVQIAFRQGNWLGVLQQAQQMPDVAYWKQQIAPLVQQATSQANAIATALLQDAYDRAIAKDFGGAIAVLRQIPAGTNVYATAQTKLSEYSQKQQVQAISYLQTAYNQAEQQDFTAALAALKQIPPEVAIYPKAQAKMREYREKQLVAAPSAPDFNPGSYLRETNVHN